MFSLNKYFYFYELYIKVWFKKKITVFKGLRRHNRCNGLLNPYQLSYLQHSSRRIEFARAARGCHATSYIIPLPHRATPLPPCRKLSLMRIVLSCMPDSISTPGVSNFSRSCLSLFRMLLILFSFSIFLRMINAEAIEQNLFYLVCLSCIFPFFKLYMLNMISNFMDEFHIYIYTKNNCKNRNYSLSLYFYYRLKYHNKQYYRIINLN